MPIYIEATAADTEVRLLKGLKKHCPELPDDVGLPELIARLRDRGGSRGRKVLLVLDQFEQWLHAHATDDDSQLVPALRQCDGAGVQCLLMVRDDFSAAVHRFFQDLEAELSDGRNYALVDLFAPEHARKVLAAFGRAYERLPQLPAEPTEEQTRFLERAVEGLAREGKVVCVRLAVFAEMMKGRVWTEDSLREVGGTEGVGVTFLEETFVSKSAPPPHQRHQQAVQLVLQSLLPEVGTDIKGQMRSYDQLLEASGYQQRRQDFAALLRILDSDVRLITPTEPDGAAGADQAVVDERRVAGDDGSGTASESEDLSATRQPGPATQYYQLTHDYLVPSIREWLNRGRRRTRRGRAELRLEERAALWRSKPETRHLPSLLEYVSIRTLTDTSRWTAPQKSMMGRAWRFYAWRSAAVLGAMVLLAVGTYGSVGWFQARALVATLMAAKEDVVLGAVSELTGYRLWARPMLRDCLAADSSDPDAWRQKHRARLALMRCTSPAEAEALAGEFREELADAILPNERRFSAGLALASWPATAELLPGETWEFLARQLIVANPESQPAFRDYLRAEGAKLLTPLQVLFASSVLSEPEQVGLANALADFGRHNGPLLARLLRSATKDQYPILFARYEQLADGQGPHDLLRFAAQEPAPTLGPDQRVALGKQRAGAAITLLRQGAREEIFDVLRVSDDPESLTQFVHRCRERGVKPTELLECLDQADKVRQPLAGQQREMEDRVLFGLLLALGEFQPGELPPGRAQPLIERLAGWYASDPSSAIHGATGWLLRHWGQEALANQVDQTPVDYSPDRQWYIVEVGAGELKSYLTFIVIPPGEYEIGSPPDEPERRVDETRHKVRITYPFAVLDREVTWAEAEMFDANLARAYKQAVQEQGGWMPEADQPWVTPTWDDAVRFCRWLTKVAGMSEADQAYGDPEAPENKDRPEYQPDPDPDAEGAPLNWPFELRRRGFRLPTEAEWEVACRAGVRTARSYGGDTRLLDQYAWFADSSGKQTHGNRLKRPNLRGVFDMHGNAMEWCHDGYGLYASGSVSDPSGPARASDRVIRGGCWRYSAAYCRSAFRDRLSRGYRYFNLGFRVAAVQSSPARQEPVRGAESDSR